ncbi:hypothetical protein RHOER0001_1856 [Rhodococcus erythropolis SK121]|nr:hypothetical protein RHOER0001_1856 [Rhodococcus erythropolis SK121]
MGPAPMMHTLGKGEGLIRHRFLFCLGRARRRIESREVT